MESGLNHVLPEDEDSNTISSCIIVPDSQINSTDSCEGWDLIAGLPAMRHIKEKVEDEGQAQSTMSNIRNETSTDEGDGQVTTPADYVGSLHFSAQPMLAPETMDSSDEIERTPGVYGSVPMIIPDSPTDRDNEEDDEHEITFKLAAPTMDSEERTIEETETSQRKSESQSFHLRYTPSQMEESQQPDLVIVESLDAAEPERDLRAGQSASPTAMDDTTAGPSFRLPQPAFAIGDLGTLEESEESISVFQRVKSGMTSPQKKKKVVENSENFMIADPFTFHGTQSQNLGDAEKTIDTSVRKEKAPKVMRKILKKKLPINDDKSSSTDEGVSQTKSRPPRPRVAGNRRNSTEQQPIEIEGSIEEPQVDEPVMTEEPVENTAEPGENRSAAVAAIEQEEERGQEFTAIQSKGEFHKPLDPPAVKSVPSRSGDLHTAETQLLITKGGSPTGAENTKIKKSATVSFSSGRPGELARETSDGSDSEFERIVKTKIVHTFVITNQEVYNWKMQIVRRNVISEHVSTEVGTPEVVSETLPPPVSPSRSVSTVTTGDLGDISSSSLSRNNSSGSKSIPSLDAAVQSQSLPTPAQKDRTSIDSVKGSLSASEKSPKQQTNITALKPDDKRLSSGSNTGQDMFGTPNESIIERADSQLGKVISSSHSTPTSHAVGSPAVVDGASPAFPKTMHHRMSAVPEQPTLEPSDKNVPTSRGTGCHLELSEARVREHNNNNTDDNCNTGRKDERPSARKKRKIADSEDSSDSVLKGKRDVTWKGSSKKRDELGESNEVQSTGFSVHPAPPSVLSGDTIRSSVPAAVVSPKSSDANSSLVSLQANVFADSHQTTVLTNYKSKLETGAKVMGKWKDGYFYPGTLAKVDQKSKRHLIKFDDGTQRVVKPADIILASELPVGQSVMVIRNNGFCEAAMVMGHSEKPEAGDRATTGLLYHVECDDGVTQRCERSCLALTKDQAAILLSDEELRVSPETTVVTTCKPADVSLDNLVEGKRHTTPKNATEDEPSTSSSHPSLATSVPGSGRKRKLGPVATSTPTPKQLREGKGKGKAKGTPVKKPALSPLGGVMSSPSDSRRSPRKTRTGLFSSSVTPTSKLFEGMVFMLTHLEKTVEHKAQEKRLLQDSSLDTSGDDATDTGEHMTAPFVKDRIQSVIEMGGGTVIAKYDEEKLRSASQAYLVAAVHQRTIKYLQALAAGMTIVSHQWVLDSAAENKLQNLTAYTLPAGISFERKKIIERTQGCAELKGLYILVASANHDFIDAWTSILTIAECHVVTKFPPHATKAEPGVNVVVTDPTCPTNILKRSKQLDIPLVSSDWVAQCLINGCLMDYSGHTRYKYDFTE